MVFSARVWFAIGFAICAGLLGAAYFFQYDQGLEPCPLCITQRILMALTGIVFMVALVHHPSGFGIRIYAILGGVMALLGATVSTRHVWLQHLPADQVPACGPGLEYMLKNFPLAEVIPFFFSGTGDCAEVDWKFLGLSMPAWTLLWFLGLSLLSLLQLGNRGSVVRD